MPGNRKTIAETLNPGMTLAPGDFVELRADLVPAGNADWDDPNLADFGDVLVFRGVVTRSRGRRLGDVTRYAFSAPACYGRVLYVSSEPTFGYDHHREHWYVKATAGREMTASWWPAELKLQINESPCQIYAA